MILAFPAHALPVLLLLLLSTRAPGPAPGQEKQVVATIGDEEVTLADVEQAAGVELQKIELGYQKSRHQLLEASLRNLIHRKLVEQEAARLGKTPEALLAEVSADVSVSDADVDHWYQANQDRLQGHPKEQIAPQIRQYLVEQKKSEALDAFFDRLQDQARVSMLLEPFRVSIAVDGYPSLGPANAAVTLVEFSDFECPFCNRFTDTLKKVREAFPERVRVVFRQFPLSIHPHAQKAAEASLCAADQGRFWEMHDLLFAEQQALAPQDLEEKAGRLSLDPEGFASCLDSGRHHDEVEEDVKAGVAIGVTGTPALFINGRPLAAGALPFDAVKAEIEREISHH
jgi:protein-disulfide isomerase